MAWRDDGNGNWIAYTCSNDFLSRWWLHDDVDSELNFAAERGEMEEAEKRGEK